MGDIKGDARNLKNGSDACVAHLMHSGQTFRLGKMQMDSQTWQAFSIFLASVKFYPPEGSRGSGDCCWMLPPLNSSCIVIEHDYIWPFKWSLL